MCARKVLFGSIMALAVLVGTGGPAWALTGTLESYNSRVTFNDQGMVEWSVEGTNHLAQQWLWYRVGDSTGAAPVAPALWQSFDTDWNGAPDVLTALFTVDEPGLDFHIQLDFKLTGGLDGSYVSDIAQTFTVRNLGGSSLDLHLFQFMDLDLGGDAAGDRAFLEGLNLVSQKQVESIAEGLVGKEKVSMVFGATQGPVDRYQFVGTAAGVADALDALADGLVPVSLPDTFDTVQPASGTDVAWAFQWDMKLGKNGTVIISEDMYMAAVPEPVTMASVGLCLLGVGRYVRRRRKASA